MSAVHVWIFISDIRKISVHFLELNNLFHKLLLVITFIEMLEIPRNTNAIESYRKLHRKLSI